VREDGGDVVGGDEGVCEPERYQTAVLGTELELAFRFKDRDAGALATDKGAGHVEAVLGKELVEVVARDAAGNVREACADEVGVGIAQAAQAGVDLASAPPGSDDGGEFAFSGGADRHAGAVVEQDVEGFDVVDGLAAH
jgi:hypothetical protein